MESLSMKRRPPRRALPRCRLVHSSTRTRLLNNCGPAAIAEVLRYYGIVQTQQALQAILRPNNPDGMTTDVIAPFTQSIGLRSVMHTGGSPKLIKALVRAGFPVIAEQIISTSDSQLHYRPIEAYDDQRQQFLAADPFLGPRHAINYVEFDQLWAPTNKLYIIIYPPSKQRALDAAMSSGTT